MSARLLLLRLFALLLALSAGTAAAAPPCLDLLLAETGCVAGEDDHGCEDDQGCEEGCCDKGGCGTDCEDCACCPLRVPATVSAQDVKLPALDLCAELPQPAALARACDTEDVFRPPRRSA